MQTCAGCETLIGASVPLRHTLRCTLCQIHFHEQRGQSNFKSRVGNDNGSHGSTPDSHEHNHLHTYAGAQPLATACAYSLTHNPSALEASTVRHGTRGLPMASSCKQCPRVCHLFTFRDDTAGSVPLLATDQNVR